MSGWIDDDDHIRPARGAVTHVLDVETNSDTEIFDDDHIHPAHGEITRELDVETNSDTEIFDNDVLPARGAITPHVLDLHHIQTKTMPISRLPKNFKMTTLKGRHADHIHSVLGSGGLREEQDWKRDNEMPYGYLLNVMSDPENRIILGKIGTEICSIFSFRRSGRKKNDATVQLIWTKDCYRRKGFSSTLMHNGISAIADKDAYIFSGPIWTKYSKMFFESLSWKKVGKIAYMVSLNSLQRSLEVKFAAATTSCSATRRNVSQI